MQALCSLIRGKVFCCGRLAPSALSLDICTFDQGLRLESADEPTCMLFVTYPPLKCF